MSAPAVPTGNLIRSRSLDLLHFCDSPSIHCPALSQRSASVCRTRAALQREILALRHQLGVLQRSSRTRPRRTPADRILWAWLSRIWADWPAALVIVKPETV